MVAGGQGGIVIGQRISATRIVATTIGVVAGLLGLEHGYFETLQGNAAPSAALISAIGPPCQPETAWHACEPAFTLVPSFFVTGFLAMISFACDTRTEAETR